MALSALCKTRGQGCVRANKRLFHIFSLLCLVYVANSLKTKNYVEAMKKALEETDSLKAEQEHRNATITKLFDLSSSLTNKEKLELFKETLSKAVEEEKRLKAEYKNKMEMASKELDKTVKQFIPLMELVKSLPHSPPLLELVNTAKKVLKNARTYLDKRLALLQ